MIDKSGSEPADKRDGWFTSSYSNAQGGCVEVTFGHGTVLIRDSKDRHAGRPVMGMPSPGWVAFLNTLTGPRDTS